MIKCDISKCHASCCYNAPLPKKYIFALKNRIVNPVKEILVIDDENMKGEVMCYPITDHNPDKNKCPFLTENCRCNIYDRRPPICKKFGNGTEPLLTCSFLVPEEQRESVLAGYKSAINKLTSPTANISSIRRMSALTLIATAKANLIYIPDAVSYTHLTLPTKRIV